MKLTQQQEQLKQQYEKIIGQTLIEKSGTFFRKTIRKSNGKEILVQVPWKDMEWKVQQSQVNTSINKNINKIVVKNHNNLLDKSKLLAGLKPKQRIEEYKTVGCSLKISDYNKLQKIADSHNATVGAIVKRLVDTLLESNT